MKFSMLSLIGGLMACLILALPVSTESPAGTTAATTARDWLWVSTETPVPARHLSITVEPDAPGLMPFVRSFTCDIRSDFGYRSAQVTLTVQDASGQTVSGGTLPLDISSGANQCQVVVDINDLPLGVYRAEFRIRHELLLSEPTHVVTLRKVNSENLLDILNSTNVAVAELRDSLDKMEAAGRPNPYLRLKANIVTDVLERARHNADTEAWETVDRLLNYSQDRIASIRAGLVFGSTAPEYEMAIPRPALDNVTIRNGGFEADGAAVFLFGGVLPDLRTESLALLRRYQLNAATITLAPTDGGPDQIARVRQLMDAAVNQNIGVAVQLAPDMLPTQVLTDHPDLKVEDYIDLSRPEAREQFETFVRTLGPVLTGQPMVLGVSLANDPRFHFRGEAVKAGFLDFIRAHYPDRLTLNRAWRAHLASLDNITPWSTNPYDSYQSHRPYQFDWQTYHQGLGNQYFIWSREVVQSAIPDVPMMATLTNTVFTRDETEYGVNREELAAMMQISGCSSTLSATDPIYQMSYPYQSVYYNLLKSFQPDQPVFNLFNRLEFDANMNGAPLYRYVHSAIWEGVMSGLGAATIPMDTLVFDQPDALEAFATAALDVNRLAPIVQAFQNAPADVGILFSYASKVYDGGDPHLESARNAYEGVVFGGYNVRFISEAQCLTGALDDLKILVIPDTPALSDAAFQKINRFVEEGGTVARTGAPIPYNERGFSRGDLIRNTGNTVLVRGLNLPTEYLHAMDAATVLGALPQVPRVITRQGYPIEGVKSQYIRHGGDEYLYVINVRKEPVYCELATLSNRGRDLIHGQDITFPATLDPLVPLLIKLEPARLEMTVTASTDPN